MVSANRADSAVNDRLQNQSSIRYVGMRELLVAIAMADKWMNEHAENPPFKTRRSTQYLATDKQRERLKLAILEQVSLSEAMSDHLRLQPERDLRPCPGARQTWGGRMTNWLYLSSMSDWLYLIGSFCFVAGTLLNMVQR